MFVARVFRNKPFKNYICTSSVLKCDKSKSKQRKKSLENAEKKQKTVSTSEPTQDSNNLFASDQTITFQKPVEKVKKIKFNPFEKAAKSLAKDVAERLGTNKEQTVEDLMDYLKSVEVTNERFMKKKSPQRGFIKKKFNFMSGAEDLNIFLPSIMTEKQVELKIWHELEAEELALMSKCPPRNYFEELIHWTEEGKLWHFPIDNDQGMEEEAKISFSEHVFLEKYLEPWCPQKGPLRKFMELVLIGLSKNPYITLEEKKSHIEWYKKYFEDKKKLLQELGAMGPPKAIDVQKQEESS